MPETIAAPLPASTPVPPSATAPAIVDAAQLLGGAGEILIRHAGQDYRLRITRANKLILTK